MPACSSGEAGFSGPNSSRLTMTMGHRDRAAAGASAIADSSSTRFFLASSFGSVEVFGALHPLNGPALLAQQQAQSLVADNRRPPPWRPPPGRPDARPASAWPSIWSPRGRSPRGWSTIISHQGLGLLLGQEGGSVQRVQSAEDLDRPERRDQEEPGARAVCDRRRPSGGPVPVTPWSSSAWTSSGR